MAIYHFSAKMISRGKGQSAVASASYRSDEKLYLEREGRTISFRPHEVQPDSFILAPDHAPEWAYNREKLWNEVENIENRKNSQLAREVEVSLPVELSHEQQKELIKGYAQDQFVNKGMVADISIHRDDSNNPHAHVMLTTREINVNGNWDKTKNRDWNDKELLENWREKWADHTNKTMEREGINERIDHRSHADRGLEILPTQHLGYKANDMEKKGIETERGDYNRDVEEYNKTVVDLAKYREEKKVLQERVKTQKFLKPHELVDIKNATKVINDKEKGFVSLESITKRKSELTRKEKALDTKILKLRDHQAEFQKAQFKVDKLDEIRQRKDKHLNEISRVQDIKGVWQENKWEGTKKAFERTFNRKEGNQQIERAQDGIQHLENHEKNINKELEPFRNKLDFNSREQFFEQQTKFENSMNEKVAKIENERSEIKNQRETLSKAEHALERKDVREITSNYPELDHLSETMKHKDALKLKEINTSAGKIVPVDQLRKEVDQRTEKVKQTTIALNDFKTDEKLLHAVDTSFNKLDKLQTKIDKIEDNPYHRNKLKAPLVKGLFKEQRQEHEQNIKDRDKIQRTLEKNGWTKEKLLVNQERHAEFKANGTIYQIEKNLHQEKNKVTELKSVLTSLERTEKEYQKERGNQKEKEIERDR